MNKRIIILLIFCYFAVVLGLYAFIDNPSKDVYSAFFVNIVGVSTVIAGIYTISKYKLDNYHGLSFLFLTCGVFCWFIGDLFWYIMNSFLDQSPFPSIIDGVYLMGYPFLWVGLWRELLHEKTKFEIKKYYLPIALSALLTIIICYFGIYIPVIADNTCAEKVINIAYGCGDLSLGIISIFILRKSEQYKEGKFYYPWAIIFTGFLIFLLADILYSIYLNEFESGVFYQIDFIWTAGYLIIAYGFWNIGKIIEDVKQNIISKIAGRY